MEEIGLFEAIYSQPQITRYRPDPVPREAIDKIIDAATKAPNGANKQPWEFIVITDRDLVTKVGKLYRDAWFESQGTTSPPNESPVYRSARYLAHHMPEVPAMILACGSHPGLCALHAGRADCQRPLRLVDLAGGAEPLPGRPCPWPGNAADYGAPASRSGD
jgi:nitroreductase